MVASHPLSLAVHRQLTPHLQPTPRYERYNDSSKHFITNCPEHPAFCPKNTACYEHLQQWESECIAVNATYFNQLHFINGDNFTCSEDPDDAHALDTLHETNAAAKLMGDTAAADEGVQVDAPPKGWGSFAMVRCSVLGSVLAR
jgi:hypothetical protein